MKFQFDFKIMRWKRLKKYFTIIIISNLLILLLFNSGVSCRANIIWEDSFDPPGLAEWKIFGWNRTDATPFEGNYSDSNGVLRVQGIGTQESAAEHSSTQATGTWSFDLDVTHTIGEHFHLAFFSGKFGNITEVDTFLDAIPFEYGIMVVTANLAGTQFDSEFVFYMRYQGDGSIYPLERYSPPEMIGWHHFDITRTSLGEFTVFINNSLCSSFQDLNFTTTEVFRITSSAGPAIDNIVVCDENDPTTTTTTPTITTTTTSTTTSEEASSTFGIEVLIILVAGTIVHKKRRRQ